jgi:CrcB protein
MTPVLIALAGSLGAMTRFVLDGHIKVRYNSPFPWATFIINVTGSFVLGLASGVLLHHHGFSTAEAVTGIGFCGGYTTFSTASFETVRLFEKRNYKAAFGNAAGSLLAVLVAASLGLLFGSWL